MFTLFQGDCLEQLKALLDSSVDSCVCDPPYGLSKEPDVGEVMKNWSAGTKYIHNAKGGFMGKSWDSFVPGPEYWKEVFRVLKPGGYLLAMCSTRTWDLLSVAIRFAGFENRDTISVHGVPMVSWTYGQGFPKSLDVSKAIDKQTKAKREVAAPPSQPQPITAPSTPAAKAWKGWGTALKPSWEVVLVFRKPLSEKTIVSNVLKHGTGAINVDGSRVGSSNGKVEVPSGRWPPNTLLCHLPGCSVTGTRKVKTGTALEPEKKKMNRKVFGETNTLGRTCGYASEDGTEEIASYNCVDNCPVKELDKQYKQSGTLKSGGTAVRSQEEFFLEHGGLGKKGDVQTNVGDQGGVSRFFPNLTWEPSELEFVLHYLAKATRSDKEQGLESGEEEQKTNDHPTVKPVALMRWLCTLVTPPGGVVLDPFMGSGTTGIAAIQEGFEFVGIELDPKFFEIAKERIENTRKK